MSRDNVAINSFDQAVEKLLNQMRDIDMMYSEENVQDRLCRLERTVEDLLVLMSRHKHVTLSGCGTTTPKL